MKRGVAIAATIVAGGLGLALRFGADAGASQPRELVEIWGVSSADRVEIDGASITPKGGGPRSFVGDPLAMNAPVMRELPEGTHEIVVEREGCEARRFTIDVHGSLKRSIVLTEPNAERCAIPLAPPRTEPK